MTIAAPLIEVTIVAPLPSIMDIRELHKGFFGWWEYGFGCMIISFLLLEMEIRKLYIVTMLLLIIFEQ